MPKQYFQKQYGDSAFKTIITRDSKDSETGHISAEIVDELTIRADDGTYVSANPSTGEINISADTRWSDKSDDLKINFYKTRDSFSKMEKGSLALIEGQGVFYKGDNTDLKPVAPGFINGGNGFPSNATTGSFFLSSNNQLFLCVGSNSWLKLGTSTVSTGTNLIWNESGAHMTSVADNHNYYAGSNVEDILQELGERLPLYFTARNQGDGDDTFSYGHLVDRPDYGRGDWGQFTWGKYNDYIDEIYNPANGNYYINRKDLGVRISKSEIIDDTGLIGVAYKELNLTDIQKQYKDANPNERTIFLKHKVGPNDYDYEQMATKNYAHFLLSRVPKSKLAIDTTKDPHTGQPYDIWTEFARYNNGKPPKWFDARDKDNDDPLNPIDGNGSIIMGASPVYIRTHYDFFERPNPEDNYVYMGKKEGTNEPEYQCLLPTEWNPNNGENFKPAVNEAIRRYIMNNRYFTNSPFYMDVNKESNKAGLNIFYGINDKPSSKDGRNWTYDKRNVFTANDNYVGAGDPKRYLRDFEVRANNMKIYGDTIDFGASHVKIGGSDNNKDGYGDGKLTVSGDLELTGRVTNNSDMYFSLKGAGIKDYGDKSIVNIGFKSDDAQVQGSLTADCRNAYGDKDQYRYNSNLYFNDDNMQWYKYNSIGRFGLRDNNVGEYFIVRESTYDYTYDEYGNHDGIAKKVAELDAQIKKTQDKKKIEELTNQRNSLLRSKERGLMTTIGGTGQTMIKSNNSSVVLRSDKSSGHKVIASASKGNDVFTIHNKEHGGSIVFGMNENVKNYNSNAYSTGKINFIDSRGANGKYTDRQELGFISTGEYHNVQNGVFQIDEGQQWNSSFIAIGASPVHTSWTTKEPGKTVTHHKNYGNTTFDGHLRLYSFTRSNGNKEQQAADHNNYARIDFDINNQLIQLKYVDERVKDYAKTKYANLKCQNITCGLLDTINLSTDELILGLDRQKFNTTKGKFSVEKMQFHFASSGLYVSPYFEKDYLELKEKYKNDEGSIQMITKDGKFLGQDLFLRCAFTDPKTKKQSVSTYSLRSILKDVLAKTGLTSKYPHI